ncbi:cystathionine beta-lyase [Echria macrotheca]|uniref:Cystathionine beta-lyase n=1 Tax=Echria macrotheca TaxID=438768 RepID=A0AAJ0BIB4_9PEZI|nr:cystathionine beta-lyase [Echria macrotheca]
MADTPRQLSLATRSIHADDSINTYQDVAPAMHVSTTFRYSRNPEDLHPWTEEMPELAPGTFIYSRESAPNTTRFETLLSSLLGNAPVLTYASGLAAFHAMLVHLNPRRVAIGGGYHGCHGVLSVLHKLNGLTQLTLSPSDLDQLQPGDVIHIETPLNPTGEARNLEFYHDIAKTKNCFLTVDATFAPPPLLDPFAFGVDIVMHSGTKYFGGHSDMLSGVLAVRPERAAEWIPSLKFERLVLGGVMGSLEGWLGVRSLRTLELRVTRQSENAQRLVDWLVSEKQSGQGVVPQLVDGVAHASQQPEAREEGSWLRRQMPNGYGPVFALYMKTEEAARRLPSKVHLFHHATSLGGVESLIEWRAMSDRTCDRRLLRVSVGVEGWEDLRDDLLQGLEALEAEQK